LCLYNGLFDPSDEIKDLMFANDDIADTNYLSRLPDMTLNAGTKYIIVVTGFSQGDLGIVDFSVTGPGSVTVSDLAPDGGSSHPLTPYEWVLLSLNAQQLLDHYGPTPQGFVEMLYGNLCKRVYDDEGRNYWIQELASGAMSADQVVGQFIFENEIASEVAVMTNEEFVTFLYHCLFALTPDAEGYAQWVSFMSAGNSKTDTLMAFLNNPEWTSICAMYNVTP
jgi:hypothetical protein